MARRYWIFSFDLVSSVEVESFPSFTDHKLVIATVSYQLEKPRDVEESFLLDSGSRLKKLNFVKAPWPLIQDKLSLIDWAPMVELSKENPTNAHAWFIEKLVSILEALVPVRKPRNSKKSKIDKKRNLLWRRLNKIKSRIKSAT